MDSIVHEQSFTKSGGVEEDPIKLFNSTLESVSRLNTYVLEHNYKVLSVSITSIVSTLVGLDSKYDPITPVYLYSDTRNKEYVDRLTDENENDRYQRTGVKNHTSYQPSRLLWLRENYNQYHNLLFYFLANEHLDLALLNWFDQNLSESRVRHGFYQVKDKLIA